MNYSKLYLFALAIVFGASAFSQSINSPYSGNGIGEIAFQGLPQNYGMGEVGIAMASPWYVNLLNPALLTSNTLSSFQVGLEGEVRRFRTERESNSQSGLSLRSLALSMPIISKGRWVTAFALMPLSTVNYNTTTYTELEGPLNSKTDFSGSGGLSQFIWANGFHLGKSLNVGFKASYVFGSITHIGEESLVIDSLKGGNDVADNFIIAHDQTTSYSDFRLSFGASYKIKISDDKSVQLGAISEISQDLNGNTETSFQRKGLSGSVASPKQVLSESATSVQLPLTYGVGVSYQKWAHYKVGLDVKRQNWGNSTELESDEQYKNATAISLGGEWVPNYQSLNNYFSRATYRIGFSYKELPYLVNKTDINDFGINFGTSLPMTGASSLDLAFKIGVRGTTQNNLIRENYFQFVLGATINDRWFIKRRYD